MTVKSDAERIAELEEALAVVVRLNAELARKLERALALIGGVRE